MKHKLLVLAPLFVVLLLLSVSAVAAQAPAECTVNAPQIVNEGQDFNIEVYCWSTSPSSNFYGFQFGTTVTGNASTTATGYTPGDFVTDVGADQTLVGHNSLDNYAVSRSNGAPAIAVAQGVSLGSVVYTANSGLIHDGSATVDVTPMLLGDIWGGEIEVFPNDYPLDITIRDLYSLNLTVKSDGVVSAVNDVAAVVDSLTADSVTPSATPPSVTFVYTDQIINHTLPVRAEMRSHLYCIGNVTLTQSVTTKTVELKAGDVYPVGGPLNSSVIDNMDAQAIGLQFGSTTPTGEVDVNSDGKVSFLDLIHVGRNWNQHPGVCWS